MKLLVILTALTSQVALAQVDLATTQPIHVPEVKSTAWTQEDVSKVIPTDISVSSDSGYVATRIGDHAIQNWLNSPEIRNSKLGRTADMVQETMKTEMTVAGDDVDETQHKFTFQVLALQAISQLKYSGWLNAALNFDAKANETKVEVSEKLFKDKDFIISHTSGSQSVTSSVGLRWDW